MTTRTDLLPCPFCGGEASAIEDTSHSTAFEVGCFNGNCALEPYIWAEYKTVAVAAWNTRAAIKKDKHETSATNIGNEDRQCTS